MAFYVWFLSLGITFSRFIQVVACISESESHSVVTGLFATPWTIPSMEFSRPEYWNG